MSLASYSVERYRSFVRPTTVELRPLTLLFGFNSAGKSALLRALPLLAKSTGGAGVGPLALDAVVARSAAYPDIRSRLTKRNDLVFGVRWDDEVQPVREIEFHLREEDKTHVIDRIIARDANGVDLLEIEDLPGEKGHYKIRQSGLVLDRTHLFFHGIRPDSRGDGALPASTSSLLETISSRLEFLDGSVTWLGAVRSSPERKGSYRGSPARIGGTGERAADKLAYDKRGAATIFPRVSRELSVMFKHLLYVRDDGEEYALELGPSDGGSTRVSIVDAGEGVTQVLPVLVLGALALAGELGTETVLAIEQPEMHLHPGAERALTNFLCAVANAPSHPRLVVETHSENLLLSVQLAIASGTILPENVSVLWVEQQEDGQSAVQRIPIDASGRPSGWPAGVFSEDAEIARELFLTRSGRQS
jgi:AAA domain, putative AbiEii toxin, Type IV TA system